MLGVIKHKTCKDQVYGPKFWVKEHQIQIVDNETKASAARAAEQMSLSSSSSYCLSYVLTATESIRNREHEQCQYILRLHLVFTRSQHQNYPNCQHNHLKNLTAFTILYGKIFHVVTLPLSRASWLASCADSKSTNLYQLGKTRFYISWYPSRRNLPMVNASLPFLHRWPKP